MKKTIAKLFCLVCALFASQNIMAQSELLVDEPFNGSLGTFTAEYADGKDLGIWQSGPSCVFADAYEHIGPSVNFVTYAVSPEVELASDGVINFEYMCNNFADLPAKEVFVSVRTVGGEWQDIIGVGEFNDPQFKNSGDIQIPAEFNGKKIQVGMKYTSKGSNFSGTWYVKNFKLYGVKNAGGGSESNVVFEESFGTGLGEFAVEGFNGLTEAEPIWFFDGGYVTADAYMKHEDGTSVENYLVSPVITLANESQFAHFEHSCNYFTVVDKEVAFSIRTVGGTWTDLKIPAFSEPESWCKSGSVVIPEEFNGKDVQFGFKYTAQPGSEGVWSIKNFVVEKGSGVIEKVDPELSFSETELSFPFDSGDFIEPVLNNPNNLAVTYTSSDFNVAMVNSKGEVTILSEGVATITAKSKETDEFKAGEASYTLTVTAPLATKVVFSEMFDTSLGEFTVEGFNGQADDIWRFDVAYVVADPYGRFTTTVENYLVSPVISLTNESHFVHYSQSTSYFKDPAVETSFCIRTVGGEWQALPVNNIPTSGEWGETGKIMIPESFLGQDVQFGFRYSSNDPGNPGMWCLSKFYVEKYCTGADPEVSYIVNETIGFIDREFTSPAIVNPNNVAFTFASSNPEVATVDAQTGDVTIVAEGQTVITATSVETDDFISAETSYTLYVKQVSAADVVYEAYFDDNFCGFAVEGFNGDELPIWKLKDGAARADAYNKVANASTNYLVSPVVTLAPTLSRVTFDYKFVLDAAAVTPLEDQFAFCVREEGGEWERLAITNLVSNEMVSSGEIDIPEAYNEKKVQFGFMYFVEDGQKTGVLTLDNFIVKKTNIATAIEGVTAEDLNNGKIYDLQGRRVNNLSKGIYVVNGKKVVIK